MTSCPARKDVSTRSCRVYRTRMRPVIVLVASLCDVLGLDWVVGFSTRLLDDDKRLLPLPLVPLERPCDRLEPVRALLVRADCREGILGRCDSDMIALCDYSRFSSVSLLASMKVDPTSGFRERKEELTSELHATSTVERSPGCRSRIVGDDNPKLHAVGQKHGPEG